MATYSIVQAQGIITSMNAQVAKAELLDRQEWDSARGAIEGCSIQKQEISADVVAQTFQYPKDRINELSNEWLAKVFGPGLIFEDQAVARQAEWQSSTAALAQLRERINGLDMASWQGDGADNYRQRIAEVSDYVARQERLTTTADADLGKVNEGMTRVNSDYRTAMVAGQTNVNAVAMPAANTHWPTADWWQINKNAEQYSFTFFTRTAAVSQALFNLCNSLSMVQSGHLPTDASSMGTATETTNLGGPPPPQYPNGYCIGGPPKSDAPASGYE